MEKVVVIKNETGLHARPAGMFVKKASEFTSTVEVKCKGKVVNAKSIMGIMSLGLGKGEEVTICAAGAFPPSDYYGGSVAMPDIQRHLSWVFTP